MIEKRVAFGVFVFGAIVVIAAGLGRLPNMELSQEPVVARSNQTGTMTIREPKPPLPGNFTLRGTAHIWRDPHGFCILTFERPDPLIGFAYDLPRYICESLEN